MPLARSFILAVFLAAALAACGGPAAGPDAAGDPADASVAPDAMPPPPPGTAALVLSAGGTVESASFTLDVQLGEALLPRPVAAGDTTLAPSSAIHR
jgi:hypothetical protein